MSKINLHAQSAPVWRQVFAILYDTFLLMACLIVIGFIFIGINKGEVVLRDSILWHCMRGAILLVWMSFFVYFWSSQGQTLGMRAWRLIVIDSQGRVPSAQRALLRWCLALLTCAPLGLGFFWQLFDSGKRTLYDRLSRTSLCMVEKNPYRN